MFVHFMRAGRALRRFAADRRGNTALIFALSAFPLLLAMGVAVDTSRTVHHRTKLANALDAAGLAAGASFYESEAELEEIARHYLKANLGEEIYALTHDLQVSRTGETLHVAVEMDVPTLFMRLVDIDSTALKVDADIVRENKKLEVALVLDNTGSMAGSKIESLREASKDLVEILFGDEREHPLLRVAIVPYVTAVNIRGAGYKDSWIDWYAESTHQGENFETWDSSIADDGDGDPGVYSIRIGGRDYALRDGDRIPHALLFHWMEENEAEAAWKGCVESRAAPFDTTDDAPQAGTPDTLFTPYLWPDEPERRHGTAEYDNDYIEDDSGGKSMTRKEYAAQQRAVWKYRTGEPSADNWPSTTSGPNKSCARPVTPLTNDRDALLDELDEMEPWNDGGTNGAAGMAWGWRVLSPGEPYSEGAAYDARDVEKVMVMMTDGENQIYGGYNNHNQSHYSAYNYLGVRRLGVTGHGAAKGRINDRMALLCENIKAEGITLYTITFRLNSGALKDLYRDCASSPDHYFDSTSNGELEQHFQTIARQLSELRLAR